MGVDDSRAPRRRSSATRTARPATTTTRAGRSAAANASTPAAIPAGPVAYFELHRPLARLGRLRGPRVPPRRCGGLELAARTIMPGCAAWSGTSPPPRSRSRRGLRSRCSPVHVRPLPCPLRGPGRHRRSRSVRRPRCCQARASPPTRRCCRRTTTWTSSSPAAPGILAVRTSLVHFASPLTRIVVFRSDDQGATWSTESVIDRRRDLREPRFLDLDGKLFLYFFEAGVNPLAFEPGRVLAIERTGAEVSWSDPVVVSPDDSVVWRTKIVDGVPYMVRYRGGGDSYAAGEAEIEVELLTTDDGYDWRPGRPGSSGRAHRRRRRDGLRVRRGRSAVGRDAQRGRRAWPLRLADLHRAARRHHRLGRAWTTRGSSTRRWCSPTAATSGCSPVVRWPTTAATTWAPRGCPGTRQLLAYQAAYWVTPKRLALWKLDTDRRQVDWVADLPSRGDTAFPGIVLDGARQPRRVQLQLPAGRRRPALGRRASSVRPTSTPPRSPFGRERRTGSGSTCRQRRVRGASRCSTRPADGSHRRGIQRRRRARSARMPGCRRATSAIIWATRRRCSAP